MKPDYIKEEMEREKQSREQIYGQPAWSSNPPLSLGDDLWRHRIRVGMAHNIPETVMLRAEIRRLNDQINDMANCDPRPPLIIRTDDEAAGLVHAERIACAHTLRDLTVPEEFKGMSAGHMLARGVYERAVEDGFNAILARGSNSIREIAEESGVSQASVGRVARDARLRAKP